jgi:membrane-bound lytic murein transglycosylase MltF
MQRFVIVDSVDVDGYASDDAQVASALDIVDDLCRLYFVMWFRMSEYSYLAYKIRYFCSFVN